MDFVACQQARSEPKSVQKSFNWNAGVVSQDMLSADRVESQGDLLLDRSTKRVGCRTKRHGLGRGRCRGFCYQENQAGSMLKAKSLAALSC